MAVDAPTPCGGPSVSFLTGQDMRHIRLCPAIAFDQILGGRYKLHILSILAAGPRRFGEIGRSLQRGSLGKPITPRVLSRELKDLQARGLLSREDFGIVPRKVVYTLTDVGRGLLPVMTEIVRWGATGAHERILGMGSAAAAQVPRSSQS